ncbi:MAG: hypothetical protein ACK4HW_02350 [Roseinatronobacter sp.]
MGAFVWRICCFLGPGAAFAFMGNSSSPDSSDTEDELDEENTDDTSPSSPAPELPPEEDELERIVRTGLGNDDDNLILPRDENAEYFGRGGNDTLVGFPEFGVRL